MSSFFKVFIITILFLGVLGTEIAHAESTRNASNIELSEVAQSTHEDEHGPSPWSVIPFAALLIMIATGPLFYEHFWHKNYPLIAISLGAIIVAYYIYGLHNHHSPVHSFFEYFQFISLLAGLFVASGGIMINVDKEAKPITNVIILAIGGVISNIIGTTGASMLLIRPFIRLNRNRVKAYHIIFFIFIVSNIGGSLTPIGDPPLFLGFLKGVPFFWTAVHNFVPWLLAVILILGLFYFFDTRNKADYSYGEEQPAPTGEVSVTGTKNFAWLAIIVGSVFLDPNVFSWVPAVTYEGQSFSFLRELIMLSSAVLSYKLADKEVLKDNGFSFEPIREVAFIFVGIFATMMPALEIVGAFAKSPAGADLITPNALYWGTGLLSGFLDNAPTYINFLTAAMASTGASINNLQEVISFANGGYVDSILDLKAISIAAVFFGAMTYIGNGPNFMVKSIAEQVGIKMPSFFGYIIRFSIPMLIPIYILVWLIFFAFK